MWRTTAGTFVAYLKTVRDTRLGHCIEVTHLRDELHITRWWLRSDPPAVVWQCEGGVRNLIDQHGHRIHFPGETTSHRNPYADAAHVEAFHEYFCVDALVARSGGHPPGPTSVSAEAATNGLCTYEWSGLAGGFHCTRWVTYDPVTRRVYGCDLTERHPHTGEQHTRTVRAHFSYDDLMEARAFEFPPAADVSEPEEDAWGMPARADAVGEAARAEVSARVQHLLRAWLSGSAEEFLEDWHFLPESLHDGLLPARAVWEHRVTTQAVVWQGWEPQVGEPVKRNRICVPLSVRAFQPLAVPGAMEVAVTWRPPRTAGPAEEIYSEVFLLEHEGRLRVVHWDLPWVQDSSPHYGEAP